MEIRNQVNEALKSAMRNKDAPRLSTLRLISAAIKDRDIALRGKGDDLSVTDADILAILAKMIKQRQESARAYEEGGRLEMAERERAEIVVITDFLPRQLDDAEIQAAIATVIKQTGAKGIRDMGRVIEALKARYSGRMDFGKVGPQIRDQLSCD